ncbi:DUF4296 domain-containing protein [Flagellimonas taeanensis]|uniref:DUF4296 domain-containing protein n=1 Tax=Flavobacteriaceae TaxID=49546 RepID=UPI000E6A438F|nr:MULTISPECIES: DUF4296 domain-containing protein [Allomuricauda]MDC6385108.1 DUF4296 domain-containing protein [Muricauda sp. SK9]RIV52803.1 DUF4296 domain-containing protein [Allomuricauda taeanensis]
MKKLLFLLVFLMVVSCAEKVVEEPDNLIPKEKMVDILHDLAILNATKTTIGAKLDESGIDIMEFLYQKYQIDSTQFSESDLYYASLPLEYQAIYTEVETRLDKRQKAMEEATEKKNDSIRKANEKRSDSIRSAKILKDSIIPEP